MKKFYRKRGGYVPFIPKNKTRSKNTPFGVQSPRTYTAPKPGRNIFSNVTPWISKKTNTKAQRSAALPKTQTQTQEQDMRRKRRLRPTVGTIGRRRPTYRGTRRPKTNLVEKIRMTGQGATGSYFRKYARRMNFRNRVENVSPEQYFLRTSGSRLAGGYGKQSSTSFQVMALADLNEVSNNIPGYNDNTKCFIKNFKSELVFTNQAKTNVFVDVYEVKYRKSSDTSPRFCWTNGLTDYGVAGLTLDTYGVTPFKSKLFTQMMKVDRIYRLELGAGRTHRHVSNYSYNKDFTRQEISTSGTFLSYLEDWTRAIIVIAKGEPVNDQVTKTTVVPSSVAIDFVWKEEIKYHYGQPIGSSFELINAMPTTGVVEYLMDEASGAAETQETA